MTVRQFAWTLVTYPYHVLTRIIQFCAPHLTPLFPFLYGCLVLLWMRSHTRKQFVAQVHFSQIYTDNKEPTDTLKSQLMMYMDFMEGDTGHYIFVTRMADGRNLDCMKRMKDYFLEMKQQKLLIVLVLEGTRPPLDMVMRIFDHVIVVEHLFCKVDHFTESSQRKLQVLGKEMRSRKWKLFCF